MEQLNVYVPKRLRAPIEEAAKKENMTRAKWLLMLAELELDRLARNKKGRKT